MNQLPRSGELAFAANIRRSRPPPLTSLPPPLRGFTVSPPAWGTPMTPERVKDILA